MQGLSQRNPIVNLTKIFSRKTSLRAGIAALALAGITGLGGTAQAQTVTLVETGSSLLYPLFNLWVPDFTAANPDIRISTTSTGSGAGIAQAIKGLVQIGASDAYVSDAMSKKFANIMSIPLAISAQDINYNLPGVKTLKLSGPILAGIYMGTITKWDDPKIAAANPGVTLPDHTIIPIHRLDGSGDTFIFSQYLADSTPAWKSTLNYSTTISWPAVPGGIGAKGNAGMLAAAAANPYSVAYIGISYAGKVAAAGLGTAALKDADGEYVLPTPETIAAAANSVVTDTPPDERISMIFAQGPNAYPIVNYEYAVVSNSQPNGAVAGALQKFLTWAITTGNGPTYLDKVHFLALPTAIQTLSQTQIAKIQ